MVKNPFIGKGLIVGGAFVLIVLFLSTIITASPIGLEKDEYYFEDVDITVIGRCRSCGGTQIPLPLFIGYIKYFDFDTGISLLEHITMRVIGELGGNTTIFFRMRIVNVNMYNATGLFFISRTKAFGASLIPPIIFIKCHVERLWIEHWHI